MPSKPPVHKPRGSRPRRAWERTAPPKRLTGRPWRRLRDRILERDRHLCQQCLREARLTVAHEVDHIVPVAEGGTDAETNLEAICDQHHRAKTQAEAKRGAARTGAARPQGGG